MTPFCNLFMERPSYICVPHCRFNCSLQWTADGH